MRRKYSKEETDFYHNYINSQLWRQRRKARIALAGGCCEHVYPDGSRCGSTRFLSVHHNTYERLGAELDQDLDVLCWLHHMVEHMLWKRCSYCNNPSLEDPERAERWLKIILSTMSMDWQDPITTYRMLPHKNTLFNQVPSVCDSCGTSFCKDY